MRTFKSIAAALTAVFIMVLVGCGDEMVTPLSSGQKSIKGESKVPANYYQTKLSLKPGQISYFNRSNTGINLFHAVRINDCYKQNIEVIGFAGDLAFLLDCRLKGFSVTTVSVENKSQDVVDIEVNLFGDVEIIDPGVKDIKTK